MLLPINDPKTHQVASVGHGGHRGGSCSCQSGCGQGQQTGNAHQKDLVPQAEIKKQTHIQLRDYSTKEYKKWTPAEKQKLWQLKNASKTPGTGPTIRNHNAFVALTLTISSGSGVEDLIIKDDQPSNDVEWGRRRNSDHPALGRQVHPRSDDT